MIPQFVISFREALEVVLIVAVLTGALYKLGMSQNNKHIFMGVGIAVITSLLLGIGVYTLYELTAYKAMFEIAGSYLAVVVLTYVVYHMGRSAKTLVTELREKVAMNLYKPTALLVIGFVVTFREGVEMVLFMIPFLGQYTPMENIIGLLGGILLAIFLAALIYILEIRLPLKKMFVVTSIMIIFIASGILGYAVHETLEYMEENGVAVDPLGTYVYNLNLPNDHPMNENNVIGGILSALIGYSSKMEIGRVILQFGYLGMALYLYLRGVVWTRD